MVIYIVHHRDYAVGKFVDSIIVHITILAAIAIGTYNYTRSVCGGLISFQHTTASYLGRSSIVRQSNSRPDHSSGTSNLPAFFPLLVSRFSLRLLVRTEAAFKSLCPYFQICTDSRCRFCRCVFVPYYYYNKETDMALKTLNQPEIRVLFRIAFR